MLLEYHPKESGMSLCFGLLSVGKRFGEFYGRVQSISILCSSSYRQMTIIHLIPVWSILDHLHQVQRAFRSREAVCSFFLSQSFTVLRATPNVLVSPLKLLRS